MYPKQQKCPEDGATLHVQNGPNCAIYPIFNLNPFFRDRTFRSSKRWKNNGDVCSTIVFLVFFFSLLNRWRNPLGQCHPLVSGEKKEKSKGKRERERRKGMKKNKTGKGERGNGERRKGKGQGKGEGKRRKEKGQWKEEGKETWKRDRDRQQDVDCAIYRLPLRSMCTGKGIGGGKGERRQEKGEN